MTVLDLLCIYFKIFSTITFNKCHAMFIIDLNENIYWYLNFTYTKHWKFLLNSNLQLFYKLIMFKVIALFVRSVKSFKNMRRHFTFCKNILIVFYPSNIWKFNDRYHKIMDLMFINQGHKEFSSKIFLLNIFIEEKLYLNGLHKNLHF